MRVRADSELEAVNREAAAYKEKLQEAASQQGAAARLAAALDVARNLHKDSRLHVTALENRSVWLAQTKFYISFQ